MIITSIGLMNQLKDYKSPKSKITRMLQQKELIQIKRGLFLKPGEKYSLKAISATLYGPSYISFQSALSYYNLIPERVSAITCATFGKNKNKEFKTEIGDFYYYHIPDKAFPYEIKIREENGYKFQIATPEKAILDTLYQFKNDKEMIETIIFDNLRIEKNDLINLDRNIIMELAKLYNRRICLKFANWLAKEVYNA